MKKFFTSGNHLGWLVLCTVAAVWIVCFALAFVYVGVLLTLFLFAFAFAIHLTIEAIGEKLIDKLESNRTRTQK